MASEVGEDGVPQLNSAVGEPSGLDYWQLSQSLRFVEKLEEQYVCPCCDRVVINPHQTSCGHIFCLRCIRAQLESGSSVKCPKDGVLIKSNEVFQDNCCKREILNLEVYCINYPECSSTAPLCHLQEHLKTCQYATMKHPNQGWPEVLPHRDLKEDSDNLCVHRKEPCPQCHQPYLLTQIKEKMAQVQVHEDAALNEHLLLVLENNAKLDKQIHILQQDMSLRQLELNEQNSTVSRLERAVQQETKSDQVLSVVQRSLEEQKSRVSSIQLQLQQVSVAFGQDSAHTGLAQLKGSLGMLSQHLSIAEGLKERLGVLEGRCLQHTRLLEIHVDQLQHSEERFRGLESSSYSGKLIWKIRDYQKRKEAASRGHAPPILSSAFYTGRSGYKLSARAYLNGHGSGWGTHLSLYLVLMRGDFDSLLPWPFRQTITLTVLDQSTARKHISASLVPDAASCSFTRPVSDTSLVSGFPRFLSLSDLEDPKNSAYVKDDTLFIKIKVDTSGLEDL